MAEINGGELLARCLANEGVKFIFGLPCPEIDPLLAALEKYDIRLVPIRHEAAAVHMAEGVYRTSGQVAAVLGNPGPGSANLLPGRLAAAEGEKARMPPQEEDRGGDPGAFPEHADLRGRGASDPGVLREDRGNRLFPRSMSIGAPLARFPFGRRQP